MKKHIITLGGYVGAGKSTAGKRLAEKLQFTHYSSGDFMRASASQRGMSFVEYDKVLRTTSPDSITWNKEIDRFPEELSLEKDNLVIDAHIGFYFAKHSFNVYLDIDPRIAAERIFAQNREDEKFASVEEVLAFHKDRAVSMQQRFLDLYNVDIRDLSHYDLVIDTGLIENDVPTVVEKINTAYQNWLVE